MKHSLPPFPKNVTVRGFFFDERSHSLQSFLPLLSTKKVLLLASGDGSNFENLVKTLQPLGVEIVGLFCDHPSAFVVQRAERLGVPCTVWNPEKESCWKKALQIFLQQKADWILLAGFMKILPKEIIERFPNKIINLHPSLLPAFQGLHAIERSYQSSESELGITIHYATEKVDQGPVIAQVFQKRDPSLITLDLFAGWIHRLEHALFPRVVLWLLLSGAEHSGWEKAKTCGF